MQVRIVEAGDRARYGAALAEMHRHRRRLFVDTLGWRALTVTAGQEIDAFDGPAATYLLACDAGGAVRGSLRLLPTTGPHMLTEVFAHFVDGPPPRAPGILEWSRHAPGLPEWPPAVNAAARIALHLGVLEYAAARGVTGFTAVMETWLVRRARRMGWACTPLGRPQAYGEGEAVALLNSVVSGHLAALRAQTGWTQPVLAAQAAAA